MRMHIRSELKGILFRTRGVIINMKTVFSLIAISMQMMTVMGNAAASLSNHPDTVEAINRFTLELHKKFTNEKQNVEKGNVIYFPICPWEILLQNSQLKSAISESEISLSNVENDLRSESMGLYVWQSSIYLYRERFPTEKLNWSLQKIRSNFEIPLNYGEIENFDDGRMWGRSASYYLNKWINAKSGNKNLNLIEKGELTPDVQGVIMSTLHFHSIWKYPFFKQEKVEEFYLSNGTMRIPMMINEELYRHGNLHDNSARFIVLPFEDQRYNMILIIPNEHSTLDKVEEKMKDIKLSEILNVEPEIVTLYLPKFQMNSTCTLLESFLVKNPVTSENSIRYNKIIQKTFIDSSPFKRKHTLLDTTFEIERLNFKVNKPFLVIISKQYKDGNIILFYASVEHPLSME